MAALLLMAGCGQPKAKEPVKKDIGLQLYSIRNVIGNAEKYAANHEEVFKALAFFLLFEEQSKNCHAPGAALSGCLKNAYRCMHCS